LGETLYRIAEAYDLDSEKSTDVLAKLREKYMGGFIKVSYGLA